MMFRWTAQLPRLVPTSSPTTTTTVSVTTCLSINTCSVASSISSVPKRTPDLHRRSFHSTNRHTLSRLSVAARSVRESHHSASSSGSNTSPDYIDRSKIMASGSNDTYNVAFEKNSQWRRNLAELQPELFARLGKGQAPQILWIGCADSRCPETTILGLQPGDIFCHRNIANILTSTDLNSLSVIQYAVQYLKVKHIIVCGHTSCGGVAAALDNKKLGLIDTWLMPLRHLRQENIKTLQALPEKERGLKLVDLNVRRSVSVLLENPLVIEAMVERDMQVHGVIYDVGTGELNELDITEDDEIVAERKAAFKIDT